MNDRRSLIVLIAATLPIAAPVIGLFFIHDLGTLINYVLGGWVLVAVLTFVIVKLVATQAMDGATDAQRSDEAPSDR